MQNDLSSDSSFESDHQREIPVSRSDLRKLISADVGGRISTTTEESAPSETSRRATKKSLFNPQNDRLFAVRDRNRDREVYNSLQSSSMLGRGTSVRGSDSRSSEKKPDVPQKRAQPKELHFSVKSGARSDRRSDSEYNDPPSNPSNIQNPQATVYTRKTSTARPYHQNLTRNIEVEFRGRSQSPSSSSSSSAQSSNSSMGMDQHDEIHDEDLCVDKMEYISKVVDKCCSALAETTQTLINSILDTAQKDISALGFCHSQLWMFCPKGGLSSQKEDSTYVSISQNKTDDILNSVFRHKSTSYVRKELQNSESRGACSGFLSPGDAHWEYITTLILSRYQTSSSQGTAGSERDKWGSIYLIPISATSEYSVFSNRNKCEGFIIAVKTLPGVSKASSGISDVSWSKIYTSMSLMWYKQLASALYHRLKAVKGSERGSARGIEGGSVEESINPDSSTTEASKRLNQKENSASFLNSSRERSFSAFELAAFCSKCSGISTSEGLGSLVSDVLPRVLRCSKVTLLVLEDSNAEKGGGEWEGESYFYPVGASSDDRFMNRTTLDQMSRVDSYIESPLMRHTHVMLTKSNSHVPYGALLIVRDTDTSQKGTGPGSGMSSSSSLKDIDARLSLIEIINTSIWNSMTYVTLVRTASTSEQSSKTAERVAKEIQTLKGEIASLSRLKFHADAKCAEMVESNKAINEVLESSQKSHGNAIRKSRDMLNDYSLKSSQNLKSIKREIAEVEKRLALEKERSKVAEDTVCGLESLIYGPLSDGPVSCTVDAVTRLRDFVLNGITYAEHTADTGISGPGSLKKYQSTVTVMHVISRGKGGQLIGGGGIRGILTAANEAINSNSCVEKVSEYCRPWILEREDSISQWAQNENQLVCLCVPNTSSCDYDQSDEDDVGFADGGGDGERRSREMCCFVFVKHLTSCLHDDSNKKEDNEKDKNHNDPQGDKEGAKDLFTPGERKVLLAAVKIACRNSSSSSSSSTHSKNTHSQGTVDQGHLAVRRNDTESAEEYFSRNDSEEEELGLDSRQHQLSQYSIDNGILFYRKALAFLKLKNFSRENKLRTLDRMTSELSSSNSHIRFLEQKFGDLSVMMKGLNGSSPGVSTGVTGLWARACPVLMGVMGSYSSLKNCALCVMGDMGYREGSRVFRATGSRDRERDREGGRERYGEGDGGGGDGWDVEGRASKLCVLSVAELSTPLRDQYDSDISQSDSTESSDLGCTKGLVKIQSESVLHPAVSQCVRYIMSNPSQNHRLLRLVDGCIVDEEGCSPQGLTNIHPAGDENRDRDRNRDGTEEFVRSSIDRGSPVDRMTTGQGGLTPTPTSKGDEIWLMPVRTARTVLGVLQITVKADRRIRHTPSPSPSRSFSRVSFSPDLNFDTREGEERCVEVGDDVKKERRLHATDALAAFSELFAPLLSAAQQVEKSSYSKLNSAEEIPTKRDPRFSNTQSVATEPDKSNQGPDTLAGSAGENSRDNRKMRTLIRFYADCLTLAAKGSLKSFRSEHDNALGTATSTSESVPKGGWTLDPSNSSSSSSSADRKDGEVLMTSLMNSVVDVTQGRAASRLGILNKPYRNTTAHSSLLSPIDCSLKEEFSTDIPWQYGPKTGDNIISSLWGRSRDTEIGVLLEAEAMQSIISRSKSVKTITLPGREDFTVFTFPLLGCSRDPQTDQNNSSEYRGDDVALGVFQIVMSRPDDNVFVREGQGHAHEQGKAKGQGQKEDEDVDPTVETFSLIAQAVMLTTQLLQHKAEEEEYQLRLKAESDRLTAHQQRIDLECSSWRDSSEMWRSVTGGAVALLSALVLDDDASFQQAVLLVKQNRNLIQGLLKGKEYSTVKKETVKRRSRESIAKMAAEPKEVKKKRAPTSVKEMSNSYKRDDEILDQRFQAIRALKSILSATRCLEAKTAEMPYTDTSADPSPQRESSTPWLKVCTDDDEKDFPECTANSTAIRSSCSNRKQPGESDDRTVRLEILSRTRRMIRVVCRDSVRILDLPLHSADSKVASQTESIAVHAGTGTGTGTGISQGDVRWIRMSPTSSHPAHLSPLLATQDTCLKILDLMTSLMDAEGCALLLRAQDSVLTTLTTKNELNEPCSETSYQIVCTGTALSWYGLRPREIGTVKIPHNSHGSGYSLVETCMQEGRSIALQDGTSDPRYSYVMDGSCLSETPFLAVPLRGRDGVCVGTLLAVRRRGSAFYVQEDILAAEMLSSYASIGLYWCQGTGSLQRRLLKKTKRVEQLEEDMAALEAKLKLKKRER